MGIQGARSLLEGDPRRYGQRWTCNWSSAENKGRDPIAAGGSGSSIDNADNGDDDNQTKNDTQKTTATTTTPKPIRLVEEPWILLVDGMSLLYHVAANNNKTTSSSITNPFQHHGMSLSSSSIHVSPATVKEKVSSFVSQLLQAIPPGSELRIFMDGLAPKPKIATQVDRLRNQAIVGDDLAKQERQTKSAGKNNNMNIINNNNNIEATKKPATNTNVVLPLLAEWAMVEAIEDLVQVLLEEAQRGVVTKLLELHRPSRGEAEAYIDFWIARRVPRDATKVFILADDTDFLVYQNCPGFITLSSLEIQQDGGSIHNNDHKNNCTSQQQGGGGGGPTVRLSGFQFLRQKFLDSFLPSNAAVSTDDVMPVVAALAGCDYVLHSDAQRGLMRAQQMIVKSDIGGLREKARNNPSKAQQLTAILRFVSHFIKSDKDNWVEALCVAAAASSKKKSKIGTSSSIRKDNNQGCDTTDVIDDDPTAKDAAATVLKEAFLAIRKTYFLTLTLPMNPAFEKKPMSMEIRRLFEYGIFYCRPIIECWEPAVYSASSRKRSLEDIHSALDSSSYAVVISPPFTRQVAAWIEQDSIWRMPHFYQARIRLYCLLVQFAKMGGSYSFEGGQLRLCSMWTNEDPTVTEYIRSNNNGGEDANGESPLRMHEKDAEVPNFDYVSAGWGDEAELLSRKDAVDRACLFCILGNVKQAKPALNPCLRNSGTLFLSSLFLPYNLALLLIMMGTSPDLGNIPLQFPGFAAARAEVDKVLPLMSVACYHAIFISNTLLSLFGTHSEEQKRSNLASHGDSARFRVSETLSYDKAVWIWNAIRDGADLEQLHSDDSDDTQEMKYALDYLDNTVDQLRVHLPHNNVWEIKIKEWTKQAKILWVIWWEVFNVALTNESSANMEDW